MERDKGVGNGVRGLLPLLLMGSVLTWPVTAASAAPVAFGTKLRAGGRYDNVRMCVATPAGVNGGPAMDISAFGSWALGDWGRLEFDLPVGRPILFATAFSMLQFEPSVTLKVLFRRSEGREYEAGPMLGASFHYGPDVDSESSGSGRTASFFAMGPMLGGYVGVVFKRPRGRFDVQVGVTLYGTGLVSVGDGEDHRGFVAGGSLDIGLRLR